MLTRYLPHDPGAAPGLQRPGAHHPPRRPPGHRLHPRRHARPRRRPARRPRRAVRRRPCHHRRAEPPPVPGTLEAVTEPLRRLPPRAVLRGPLRLLRVRHLDRPPPPDRRVPRGVPHATPIDWWPPACPEATSIFVGGGTPSMVPPTELVAVLGRSSRCAGDAEVTVECNPDNVTPRAASTPTGPAASTGCRSACSRPPPTCWPPSAAPTTGPTSSGASSWPASAGFDSFNLDVIYGGAGESLDDWRGTARGRHRPRPAPRLGLRPHRRGRHAARRSTPTATPTTTTRPTSTWPPPSGSGPPGSTGTRSPTGPAPATSAATTSSTGRWASTRASAAPPTPTATAAGSGTCARPSATSTPSPPAPRSRRPTSASTPTAGPRGAAALAAHPRRRVPATALDSDALPGLVEPHPHDPDRVVLTVAGRLLANEVALRLHG